MENRTFGNETSSNTTTENGIRDPVLGGTLFTINLFIVFLNTLAVLVIMRFRTKNCIDILVLGLAMMDLTKGLIPVPMSVCTYLSAWYLKKGSVACEFFGWIAFTTNSASMLILTLMAIERFVAIAKPFAYRSLITKKRMEISVLIAVLFSAGVSALPVLGLGRMVPYNHGAYCHFDYGDDTTRSKIYSIFILFYGFSMVVVVLAAYSIVFYKIRDLIKRHTRFSISRQAGRNTGKKDKGEIDLKVEKMFSYLTLGLMLLFWFSWFPFLVSFWTLILFEIMKILTKRKKFATNQNSYKFTKSCRYFLWCYDIINVSNNWEKGIARKCVPFISLCICSPVGIYFDKWWVLLVEQTSQSHGHVRLMLLFITNAFCYRQILKINQQHVAWKSTNIILVSHKNQIQENQNILLRNEHYKFKREWFLVKFVLAEKILLFLFESKAENLANFSFGTGRAGKVTSVISLEQLSSRACHL